ncbi:Bud-site selection protein [Xylaria cf. heliscus]|nr:Bud-site selection protein [Xylaria cf. heliscus]
MPKRKRGEPSLEENLAKWKKELVRGLKVAKGFERQRLSKRLREADPEKTARLEKEILVLKSLDLHQAAHAHLCSSLLKIKGVAESPKLPADIKPVPKPELSEEEKSALHNVTSALCNRKHVKDVVEEAIMGTCIALRVPMPEKRNKGKGKGKGKGKEKEKATATKHPRAEREEEQTDDWEGLDSPADDESEDAEEPEFEGPPLLKRKVEKAEGEEDLESGAGSETSDIPEFEGFSDSEAEENMFSKYDELVGGSSDEDNSDEQDEDDDGGDRADSGSRSFRKLALDDISLSSEASDDSDDSEDETLAPPSKKVKAVKPVSFNTGNSTFLPSLMGGYISGSESASDVDIAPPTRKNRRGQRARQAIWDKKYGEKAKHHQKEKDPRNAGWDMKRGAVDADGDTSKPWKKGIQNPFEKNNVHPDRQRQMQRDDDRQAKGKGSRDARERRPPRQQDGSSQGFQAEKPKPRPPPTRDDTGPLHPSWAAAKKAKEGAQKVEFQGKKVTFD